METIQASQIAARVPDGKSGKPLVSLRIEASTGWVSLRLKELWEYREFLYFLTWRDIKVRYKQTALGAAWAIIQPLLTMFVFSLFFGRLAKVPSDGLPYPLFVYTALVPWTFVVHKPGNVLVPMCHIMFIDQVLSLTQGPTLVSGCPECA